MRALVLNFMHKRYFQCITLFLSLAYILSCQSEKEDTVVPFFTSMRQYSHKLYENEEECLRVNSGVSIRSCIERIIFDTNGEVTAFLGGSDLALKGKYELVSNNIEVVLRNGPVLTLEITFNIISQNELIRTDNNTRWELYD